MKKPEQKTFTAYDFHECCEYIEKKYDIVLDDRSSGGHSLWFWLLDNNYVDGNGTFMEFYIDDMIALNVMSDTIKGFLELFQKEFGDYIYFWISW